MTIKDKIKEKLRKGTPLAQVRKEHESVSKTYEALREFLDESDKIVDERQRSLEDLRNAQAEEEKILVQTKQERVKISQENEEIAQLNDRFSEQVRNQTEELNRLREGLEELTKNGYSPEIVQKIRAITARTGSTLLSQVETVDKYNKMKKEFSGLKREKRTLEKHVRALKTERANLEKKAISERNAFDQLKIQTRAFAEAVEVVMNFKRDGYSTEDLKSLKGGLNHLQIGEHPALSISRLVKGVEMQKSLIILKDKVETERKKLSRYRTAVAEAENESEILKETTIGTIKAVKNSGLEAINNTAENADATMLDAAKKFETIINGHLRRFEDNVQGKMEKVNLALQEYTEFQKEKSRFEETVYPMMILLGSKDPQLLDQVPILFVAEALNRLLVWVLLKTPEATVIPSQYIQRKDFYLFASPHKVSVLLELASEGLKQQMIEMTQKN